jgi:hypothetical protein
VARRTSENASLPLCVSFRYISWMTPRRGRGWLENASPLEMAVEELPLAPPTEVPTAKREIGEEVQYSLCRELSAGSSDEANC